MMMDAISWYVENLTALWVSLAGGGLFRLILIGCILYWVCGGPMRCRCNRHRCRCPHCGCRCGHCPCVAGEDADDKDEQEG